MRAHFSRVWRRHRKGTRDAGLTMVAVLASFAIMMTVLLGGVAYLSSSTKYSRFDQDNDLALAAAQSGLNDLLSRLRAEDTYLDNVATMAGDPTGYCGLRATGGPEDDHFAGVCGWDATSEVGWQEFGDIVGGDYRQRFHYVVTSYDDASKSAKVVSTGRAGDVVRSISARIAKDSTAAYLWITDYELSPPKDYASYPDPGAVPAVCGGGWPEETTMNQIGYRWQWAENIADPLMPNGLTDPPARRYQDTSGGWYYCRQARFGPGDVLNGRVHSNDTILASDQPSNDPPEFGDQFTTSNPNCRDKVVPGDPSTYRYCVELDSNSLPGDSNAGYGLWSSQPRHVERLDIPKVPDKAVIGDKGCQYQGATRIIFNGDGTMTVWSKYGPDSPPKPGECGSAAQLRSSAGATVPVPTDVIYVKTAENTGTDPSLGKAIFSGEIGGPPGQELPLGTYRAEHNGPPSALGQRYTVEFSMDRIERQAGRGNAWVEGEMQGLLTIFTDESIIVTGDLMTVDPATDLLGLMAAESIEVYNPVLKNRGVYGTGAPPNMVLAWSDCTDYRSCTNFDDVPPNTWPRDYDGNYNNVTIEAAMLAGNGAFLVQNWCKTPWPDWSHTLTLKGAIGQNFRGTVGCYSSSTNDGVAGYTKNYSYNPMLYMRQPPLFPYISNGKWRVPWSEKVEPHEATKGEILD